MGLTLAFCQRVWDKWEWGWGKFKKHYHYDIRVLFLFSIFTAMKTLSLFILFAFPFLVCGQNPLLEKQIDSIVNKHIADDKMPGLSIGIVKNNEVLFIKGYGTKTIHENNPIDSISNFLTASVSKLFTATAIMQLCEQGKIDLNKKLVDYVPEFEMKDKRYKDITVYQLLTHTSGLPNFFNPNFIKPENDNVALTTFARKLKTKKLSYPPGVSLTSHTYSNTGYNMLGLIIERVSGQTFSDYMDEHILKPVGMNYSSFFYDRIDEKRRTTPHKKNWLTGKVKASNYYPDIPQDKPCGNLNSCSVDLCKWILHNLSIHKATTNIGVIKHETLETMWTTKEEIEGYTTSIGLGWWIVQSKKYSKYLFHVGNDPGYSASLTLSPDNDFGIVVLCNGMYPMQEVWNAIPFEIIDLFKDDWRMQVEK